MKQKAWTAALLPKERVNEIYYLIEREIVYKTANDRKSPVMEILYGLLHAQVTKCRVDAREYGVKKEQELKYRRALPDIESASARRRLTDWLAK